MVLWWSDLVVLVTGSAYLFGTEFAAMAVFDVLNQPRIELYTLPLIHSMLMVKVIRPVLSRLGFKALTAARAVSRLSRPSNLQMMV